MCCSTETDKTNSNKILKITTMLKVFNKESQVSNTITILKFQRKTKSWLKKDYRIKIQTYLEWQSKTDLLLRSDKLTSLSTKERLKMNLWRLIILTILNLVMLLSLLLCLKDQIALIRTNGINSIMTKIDSIKIIRKI